MMPLLYNCSTRESMLVASTPYCVVAETTLVAEGLARTPKPLSFATGGELCSGLPMGLCRSRSHRDNRLRLRYLGLLGAVRPITCQPLDSAFYRPPQHPWQTRAGSQSIKYCSLRPVMLPVSSFIRDSRRPSSRAPATAALTLVLNWDCRA